MKTNTLKNSGLQKMAEEGSLQMALRGRVIPKLIIYFNIKFSLDYQTHFHSMHLRALDQFIQSFILQIWKLRSRDLKQCLHLVISVKEEGVNCTQISKQKRDLGDRQDLLFVTLKSQKRQSPILIKFNMSDGSFFKFQHKLPPKDNTVQHFNLFLNFFKEKIKHLISKIQF